MALGVLTNTGISLGNIDIALDYLSDPSEFEPELAEVKSTIYNKEEKQHTTPKKDIVKPKLTEQALLNMFSIVPNKKEVESDINLDADITIKDSSDFDVDFDDMDFDFDDEEPTVKEEPKSVEIKLDTDEKIESTEEKTDITKHIDLNILKLVEQSEEIEDNDYEDNEEPEDDDLFMEEEDTDEMFSEEESDLFGDDTAEDDLFIDDEDEEQQEQDLFADDINDMFDDEDDEVDEQVVIKQTQTIKKPEPVKVEPLKVEPVKVEPVKIEPVKQVQNIIDEDEDDLFDLEDDDELFEDDEDASENTQDLFADDEDDDLFDLEDDDDEPVTKPVIKQTIQTKVADTAKQVSKEEVKSVDNKINTIKEDRKTAQVVKSAAEIELELLRKQLAEKDKQINDLIKNEKKTIQSTAKAVEKAASAVIKAEDTVDKLANKSMTKRANTITEVESSPYDKYTVMTIDALYKVVKEFMIAKGVRKGPLDIQMLNDKFGVDNIKKLTVKHYLIKTKKGVTVGI